MTATPIAQKNVVAASLCQWICRNERGLFHPSANPPNSPSPSLAEQRPDPFAGGRLIDPLAVGVLVGRGGAVLQQEADNAGLLLTGRFRTAAGLSGGLNRQVQGGRARLVWLQGIGAGLQQRPPPAAPALPPRIAFGPRGATAPRPNRPVRRDPRRPTRGNQ